MYSEKVLMQAYDAINYNYFDGRLPMVRFSMLVSKRNKHGWSVIKKNEEYTIYVFDYCLFENIESIYIGIMHQVIHILNAENHVEDTSRNHQYHNRRFRDVAEAHGLITRRSDAHGYDVVGIKPEMLEKIMLPDFRHRLNQAIEKDMEVERNEKKQIRKMVRFTCPRCKRKATAGISMRLYCGYCMVEMEHVGFKMDEVN